MSVQDFDRKFVIVVRQDLPPWQAINAAAHCAAYLGNKLAHRFDTGDAFVTRDGVRHPRNTQYAIVVLRAAASELHEMMPRVRQSGLLYLGFIREMVETTDDGEIERVLAEKADDQVEYLGVGLFGRKAEVDALTRHLRLWK